MIQLYNDIDLTPLSVFIACFCRHEYQALIIEGEPTEAELMDAWTTIYAQSVDICGSQNSQYVLELQKDIELLQYKITTTEGALKLLAIKHDDRIVAILRGLKYDTTHLVEGHLRYKRNLVEIESDLPPLKMKLEVKEKELKDFNAMQDEDGKESTEDSFRDMLVRLSRYMRGQLLRPTEIMAGEYFRILKDYIQYYSSKQRKTEPDGE